MRVHPDNQMNMNEMSVDIADQKAGKREIDIGQIKEVLKIINVRCGKEFYPWVKQNYKPY